MPKTPSRLGARLGGLARRQFRVRIRISRDFAIISSVSAVSQLGSMSVAVAGPLLALSLTGSPVVAGCVTAASVLPELVLHVPAGLLVDRWNRRRVMWCSQAVRMVFAIVTCLSLAFFDSVSILILMALVDASCAVFYEVAEIAAVPDLVSKSSVNAAIGSNEAKLNASMLLGRPLGGAMLAVNPLMPWVASACTSLFPVVGLLLVGLPKRRKPRARLKAPELRLPVRRAVQREHIPVSLEKGGGARDAGDHRSEVLVLTLRDALSRFFLALRGVLRQLARDPFSRAVLVVCVLANFLFQVIVLLQIYVAAQQSMPTYLIGLMLSFSGIGGFVGAVVSPWILRSRPPSVSMLLCIVAWVPLVWVAANLRNPLIGLAAWGLCSAVGAHINVALRAHQVKIFPNGQLGRIIGITRFLSVGAVALGAFSGGWIIHTVGVYKTAIIVVTVFTAIVILFTVVFQSKVLFEHFPKVIKVVADRVVRLLSASLAIVAYIAVLGSFLAGAGRRMWRAPARVCRRTAVAVRQEMAASPVGLETRGEPEPLSNASANYSAPVGRG
ncbi:MFS transporter [Actinomadura welshii]|uniref:MFS transporter n=1 Tax=Actinomadura welshii TaxID=3103817 RepID=UPI002286B1D8|nr:MFS transporter [Actinomadura madurae]